MKAALACEIVAMEACGTAAWSWRARWRWPRSADHMGDQLGSIAYFDSYPADMAVLGELSDNQIFLGHRGRYYFDVTVRAGRPTPATSRWPSTPTRWPRTPSSSWRPRTSRRSWRTGSATVRAGDVRGSGPGLWRAAAWRAVDDPRRVRDPGGLPARSPGVSPPCAGRGGPLPGPGPGSENRGSRPRSCWPTSRTGTWPGRTTRWSGICATRCAGSGPGHANRVAARRTARRAAEPALQVAGWLGDTASFGAKVPTVIFGPGGEPVYCPDEHLSVADIIEATQVYASFAALALARPGE